jgi:hypothetical protein
MLGLLISEGARKALYNDGGLPGWWDVKKLVFESPTNKLRLRH